MEKNDNKMLDIYEGKISVEDRIMLLLTGLLCFPVGFALYFYFSDRKDGKYHAQFARTGAWTGFVLVMLVFISALVFALANYLQF